MSNSKDKTLSKRVAKYRDELTDSGYERMDVAVPKALKEQLRSLGKEHNLGAAQLASIFLELALQSYGDCSKTQAASGAPVNPVALGGQSTVRSVGAQAFSMSAMPVWAETATEKETGILDSLSDTVEISPSTVRMVKQLREQALQKSLDVSYPTAVRLGYADPKEMTTPAPGKVETPAMTALEKLLKR